MMELLDFSYWEPYEGASEGSGRSEKIWLVSKMENKIGLFKFPKSEDTTEHASEKLASLIAEILAIPCAKVDIGYYQNRIGSMSYLINNDGGNISEGINFILVQNPDYNPELLCCKESGEYYSLDMILIAINNVSNTANVNKLIKQFLEIMIFDALIGNTDRHQSNWAIWDRNGIADICPIYDNGSSLCCYVSKENISNFLGKDKRCFNALVNSRSKSRIRIDGALEKEPTHYNVLEFLSNNFYNETKEFVEKLICFLSCEVILDLLREFPDSILSIERKELILKFILEKINIIRNIYK